MAGMTVRRAREIEAATKAAAEVEIDLVQPAHQLVDIVVLGESLRCSAPHWTQEEIHVSGPFMVSFFMPRPAWFDAALAGGAFESEARKRYWQLDMERRVIEIEAARDPEGLDAEWLDRQR